MKKLEIIGTTLLILGSFIFLIFFAQVLTDTPSSIDLPSSFGIPYDIGMILSIFLIFVGISMIVYKKITNS